MAKSNRPVKYAVVDAFADSAFKGNPAAVCLLEEEREDSWLQSVACEFNISETCYLTFIPELDQNPDLSSIPRFKLRWFTPVTEFRLCGHATLAASHFCFTSGLVNGNIIEFSTLSGILTAKKVPASENSVTKNSQKDEVEQHFFIELDFPIVPVTDYNSTDISLVSEALGGASVVDIKWTANEDILVVLPSAAAVADLQPQMEKIRTFPGRGMIVSSLAPLESEFDFISRFFCPKYGVNEDPVCGSAHCALALYWSKKLCKRNFLAYAASPRGGVLKLHLDDHNSRIRLQGKSITVMEGSVLFRLCGHATLAASHFCFTSGLVNGNIIEFSTLSGILTAKKVPASENSVTKNSQNDEVEQHFFIELDFPIVPVTDYNSTDISLGSEALGGASVVDIKWTENEDILVVLPSAAAIADLQPQMEKIRTFPGRGMMVSSLAPLESEFDFISWFFCPKYGVNEDPVCGSAHCALAVYWSKKLCKRNFLAYAASPRGGVLKLHLVDHNSRIRLQGKPITVMEGSVLV